MTAFSSSGRTESLPSPTPISEITRLRKPDLYPSHHATSMTSSHQSISLSFSLSVASHPARPVPGIELLCPISQLAMEEARQARNHGRAVQSSGEHGGPAMEKGCQGRRHPLGPQTGQAWWAEGEFTLPGQQGEGIRRDQEPGQGVRSPGSVQVSIVTRTRPNTSWCLCFLFCKILGLIPDSLTLRTIRGIKPDNRCRRALKRKERFTDAAWHLAWEEKILGLYITDFCIIHEPSGN